MDIAPSIFSENIGKGRLCSTRVPLHLAEQIFGAPAALATKPGGSADARLVFQCNLLDIALRALDLSTSGHEVHALGAEQWVNRVNVELKALDRWHQKLAPVIGRPLLRHPNPKHRSNLLVSHSPHRSQ